MRILLLFLFTCLLQQSVLSQQPSKEQMQAQMRQAKFKAQQQITDLEKQIADAKVNKENPETIKGLEDQLATMKKMLGIVDKAVNRNTTGPKTIADSVSAVPPYKSPYIRFFNQKVVAPTEAQAKDKLLWYKGKKINKNTLVTTKGRVIQYDRQNNHVLVQYNEKKDSNTLKIINNLKKSRQWTNTYVNNKSAEKNSFFDYPMVMLVMKEYELIEKDFDKIANNTINLPGLGTNPHASVYFDSPENRSGPSANYDFNSTDSTDPYIQQMYEEVMSRMNNPPPMDCPVPPKKEFGLCSYCNPDALEQYDREKEIWGDALHEYEVGIIRLCLTIERYFALLGTDAETDMDPAEYANLQGAQKFAMDRMDQRIKLLQQRYGNDIYRYTCVISATLAAERQKSLLGSPQEGLSYQFDILVNRIFENFMEQRIAANDYDIIFNYALILGFARQRALLGAGDDNDLDNIINDVVNHNRFAMTVQMNFKIQFGPDDKPVIIADGDLSTAQKVYVRLGRTKDCKWQFYLYQPDYGLEAAMTQEILFKIPVTVNSGTKKIKTDKGWETFTYSGPTEMSMNFPSFRISFCNGGGQDSAIMDVLRYEMEDISGYKMGKPYNIDLLEYVNKMLISVTNTKANASGLVSMADEMMNLSSQRTVDNTTGYAKLDEMQVKFKMNGKQEDLKKRSLSLDRVPNTVMLFDAQNGSCYLINNSTQSPNQEFSIDLKTAVIKIKVVCEPL